MIYWLNKKTASLRFFLLAFFFLSAAFRTSLAAESQKETLPAAPSNQQQPQKSEQEQSSDVSQQEPLLDTVDSDTGLEAMDAMEKTLQQTMLQEAQSYYPSISGIHTESLPEIFVLELEYESPEAVENIPVQLQMMKESSEAELLFKSPMLYSGNETALEGDPQWTKKISLIPNSSLSQKLGQDTKIFF